MTSAAAFTPHDGKGFPWCDDDDVPAVVVIRYRNGEEYRVDPRKRRWGPHKPPIGASDWDIAGWRLP